MFNIEDELKKLPSQPGVYLMHDAKDESIFRAAAIRVRRLSRWFHGLPGLSTL